MGNHRFHGPPKTRHPFPQVYEAAVAYVAAQESGVFPGDQAVRDLNIQLNGAHDWQDKPTEHQARRALNMLVVSGELMKTGRGERGPDGTRDSRASTYWTPAAYAAAEAKYADDRASREATRGRWLAVHDRLRAAGLEARDSVPGHPLRLGLEDWEALVQLLRQ
jgi:hypothetical protein